MRLHPHSPAPPALYTLINLSQYMHSSRYRPWTNVLYPPACTGKLLRFDHQSKFRTSYA